MSVPDTAPSLLSIPLEYDTSILGAIPAINEKYNLSLAADDYEETKVSSDQLGKNIGELVNKKDGKIDWVLGDSEFIIPEGMDEITIMDHPRALMYPCILKYQHRLLNSAKELEFLQDVQVGEPQYNMGFSDSKAYELMELLNRYSIGSGWKCSQSKGNTTDGFSVIYLGDVEECPKEYLINPNASMVAVLQLNTFDGTDVYHLAVR